MIYRAEGQPEIQCDITSNTCLPFFYITILIYKKTPKCNSGNNRRNDIDIFLSPLLFNDCEQATLPKAG